MTKETPAQRLMRQYHHTIKVGTRLDGLPIVADQLVDDDATAGEIFQKLRGKNGPLIKIEIGDQFVRESTPTLIERHGKTDGSHGVGPLRLPRRP